MARPSVAALIQYNHDISHQDKTSSRPHRAGFRSTWLDTATIRSSTAGSRDGGAAGMDRDAARRKTRLETGRGQRSNLTVRTYGSMRGLQWPILTLSKAQGISVCALGLRRALLDWRSRLSVCQCACRGLGAVQGSKRRGSAGPAGGRAATWYGTQVPRWGRDGMGGWFGSKLQRDSFIEEKYSVAKQSLFVCLYVLPTLPPTNLCK